MAYSKKILILFFIFLVLFSFCCKVHASPVDVNPTENNGDLKGVNQHDNIYDTLRNLQIDMQNDFITKMYALYSQDEVQWRANLTYIFNDLIYAGGPGQRGILVTSSEGTFRVSTYAYSEVFKEEDVTTYQFNNMTFSFVAHANVVVSRRYLTANNSFYGTAGEVTTEVVPEAFCFVMSERWIDMFKDFGILTTTTDTKILYLLQQIYATSGTDVSAKLNDINNGINNVNSSVNNLNDTINNDNVNVDSSTLPGDNTNDITEGGFNNIFNQIYTTFTSGTSKDLVITIPFTDKSFTINAANVYGNVNLGFVKTLIEAFWYFVISYFIVKDISKKINKIKSGDIEHVEENNIKEDLL